MTNPKEEKADPLSELLRRGDPADLPEAHTALERRATLLARCASSEAWSTAPLELYRRRPFAKRWAIPAMAGATAMAAGLGVAGFILRGTGTTATPNGTTRLAQKSPPTVAQGRSRAQPDPKPAGSSHETTARAENPAPTPSATVAPIVSRDRRPEGPDSPATRLARLTGPPFVATKRAVRPGGSVAVPAPAPKTLVSLSPMTRPAMAPREEVKPQTMSPKPAADPSALAKAQMAAAQGERILIIQDDTPTRPSPAEPASVAIVLTNHSQSVIVSRDAASEAAKPGSDL